MSSEEPAPFVETREAGRRRTRAAPPRPRHHGHRGSGDGQQARQLAFSSGFGLIATTAGLASPLAIPAAATAIAPLGNTSQN